MKLANCSLHRIRSAHHRVQKISHYNWFLFSFFSSKFKICMYNNSYFCQQKNFSTWKSLWTNRIKILSLKLSITSSAYFYNNNPIQFNDKTIGGRTKPISFSAVLYIVCAFGNLITNTRTFGHVWKKKQNKTKGERERRPKVISKWSAREIGASAVYMIFYSWWCPEFFNYENSELQYYWIHLFFEWLLWFL